MFHLSCLMACSTSLFKIVEPSRFFRLYLVVPAGLVYVFPFFDFFVFFSRSLPTTLIIVSYVNFSLSMVSCIFWSFSTSLRLFCFHVSLASLIFYLKTLFTRLYCKRLFLSLRLSFIKVKISLVVDCFFAFFWVVINLLFVISFNIVLILSHVAVTSLDLTVYYLFLGVRRVLFGGPLVTVYLVLEVVWFFLVLNLALMLATTGFWSEWILLLG